MIIFSNNRTLIFSWLCIFMLELIEFFELNSFFCENKWIMERWLNVEISWYFLLTQHIRTEAKCDGRTISQQTISWLCYVCDITHITLIFFSSPFFFFWLLIEMKNHNANRLWNQMFFFLNLFSSFKWQAFSVHYLLLALDNTRMILLAKISVTWLLNRQNFKATEKCSYIIERIIFTAHISMKNFFFFFKFFHLFYFFRYF